MQVPLNMVYLVATIPLFLIWIILFSLRKDLRQEMFIMSTLICIFGVGTLFYWFTIDWWRPPVIIGVRIGIEDFIMSFTTGGIMAVIYEVLFKQIYYKRKLRHHVVGAFTILLLLAQATTWLFWGVGLTSFWASTFAMGVISLVMLSFRRDLFFNALGSGFMMLIASLPFYYTIILISPEWINKTYLPTLSGVRITGIPIEELVFWFLAGFLWGPFYEYWKGERLRKILNK